MPSARCSLTRLARPPRKLGRPRICSCTSRGTLYRAPRIFRSARSRARVAFCATKSAKPEVSLDSAPAASVHRARRSDAVAGSPATIRHRLESRLSTQACLNQFGSRGSPNVSRLSALEDRLPSCKGPCQMTRSGAIKGSSPPARVASSSGPSRLRPRLREGGSMTSSVRSALTPSGRRLSTHRLMSRRSRRLALSARNTTRPLFARTGHSGVSPIQPVSGGLDVTGGRESKAMSSVYRGSAVARGGDLRGPKSEERRG